VCFSHESTREDICPRHLLDPRMGTGRSDNAFAFFFSLFFWGKTLPSLFLNRSTELHTHPAGQNVPFFKTLSIAFFSIRLTCRHREKRTIHAAVWGRTIHAAVWGRTTHIAAWGRTIHIAVWGSTVCARNVIFLLDSSTTLPIKSYGA
jgi:hypothetical protein